MRSLMKAIARALRAMRRAARSMVRTLVWVGDRLVSMLLPAPMPALDELEPDDVSPANDNVAPSENQAIRDLAYAHLQGRMPTAQQLGAVSQFQADWIASMDAEMCRRLLKASDADIRAHLQGNRAIRGVLWCDEAGIDDYATALAIDNARRERDLGLEDGYAARQPA